MIHLSQVRKFAKIICVDFRRIVENTNYRARDARKDRSFLYILYIEYKNPERLIIYGIRRDSTFYIETK